MANTWTTTRSLHSGFKRSGADLVTTITSIYLIFRFVTQSFNGCDYFKRCPKTNEGFRRKMRTFSTLFSSLYSHGQKWHCSYDYRKQYLPRFHLRSIELKQHRRSEILSIRPWRFDLVGTWCKHHSLSTLTEGSWATDMLLVRKTLDNKDFNQVVASSGFSKNKGLCGMRSSVSRAHKTWSRPSLLKDFPLVPSIPLKLMHAHRLIVHEWFY